MNSGIFKKGHVPWNKGIFGERNTRWAGDDVGLHGLHDWISRHYGKPRICHNCKTTEVKRYEWANISGKYKRDIKDFIRLCKKCHMQFDKHLMNPPCGERQWKAKLTIDKVLQIRHLYKTGLYSHNRLADKFNVTSGNIDFIVSKKTWKHI